MHAKIGNAPIRDEVRVIREHVVGGTGILHDKGFRVVVDGDGVSRGQGDMLFGCWRKDDVCIEARFLSIYSHIYAISKSGLRVRVRKFTPVF